jgi:hypothetical protein
MMKTKNIIGALFLLLFSTTACEDNLDILKHGNLGSMEDFYQTDADAEAALVAVYTAWAGGYMNWYLTKNVLSDDVWAGGNNRGDNADLHYLNEYTFGTEHGYIESLYSYYYTVIYNANLIIEKVNPDSDVKKRAIAEAKFFRAWSHFELVSLWGIAPVVDHVLQPDEYRQSTGSPEKTWAFVEQDLNDAINSGVLPSKSNKDDAEHAIRITKEVAQAMLGKACVFQKKWPEAAQTLDMVISSGKYDLYRGDYGDVLKMVANNSCEAMLELCNESVRFQDLGRWGDAPAVLGNQGKDVYGFNGTNAVVQYSNSVYGFKTNKHELLPIPAKERMLNENMGQNQGW